MAGNFGPSWFSGPATAGIAVDQDRPNIVFDVSRVQTRMVTLGGNRTLSVVGDVGVRSFVLVLAQDATGSRTVTWWSGIRWAGGTAPTLTATANKADVISFIRISPGVYFGMVAQNF